MTAIAKVVLAAALVAAGAAECRAKVGLSSQFIDVVLEGLKPGRTYNIRELRGVPYTVRNRGDESVDVLVESVIPSSGMLPAPFEAIPDPTWLQVVPNRYSLKANERGFSDLVISIPDDPSLVGRHFMGQVWAHTVTPGMFAAGVKSNIRFSIGKGPSTLEKEAAAKAMVELNYDFWPASLYVSKAKPGVYDVKKEEKRSFKLTNRSEKELALVAKAIPWMQTIVALPEGYETVEDLSWVRFEPSTVTVAGESLEEVRMLLDVPAALKGKKIVFLVQLALPIGTPVNASTRVYLQVE